MGFLRAVCEQRPTDWSRGWVRYDSPPPPSLRAYRGGGLRWGRWGIQGQEHVFGLKPLKGGRHGEDWGNEGAMCLDWQGKERDTKEEGGEGEDVG